jgi:hypothetical protein
LESERDKLKNLYIAIRGSYNKEDWTTNFKAWSSLKEIGSAGTRE